MRQDKDKSALRGPARSLGPGGLALTALLLCLPAALAAPAQAARVAVVVSSRATPYLRADAEVRARLNKLEHAAEAIRLRDLTRNPHVLTARADVVIAVGTNAAVWLHSFLKKTTPLVYCMVSDPQAVGLTQGRQAAGVSINVPLKSQFKLIAEALPRARALGLLYRSDAAKGQRLLKAVRADLPKGWRLQAVAINKHDSIAKAIDTLMAGDIDVIWTAPDATIYTAATVRSLLLSAVQKKTPVFGFSPAFVRAGALLGIGINPADQGEQAVELTERLLRSGSGSALQTAPTPPVAPKFEIAVNLIVAEKLEIELPKPLVERAKHVVKPKPTTEESKGPGG